VRESKRELKHEIDILHAMNRSAPKVARQAEELIPVHGGYRKLKSFQMAELCFDVTVRFCNRYIERGSRTRNQMIQAARSGKQNIAEGSEASGTSKKAELKLTDVARSSLEELRLDYEDHLRQRKLQQWSRQDPRRAELIARRCNTADAVADWVREVHGRHRPRGQHGLCGRSTESTTSTKSTRSTRPTYREIAANAALVLIAVTSSLLDRQIASLAAAFVEDGGFTERLYRLRVRRNQSRSNRS
jgi:four helix bundle suffix protein